MRRLRRPRGPAGAAAAGVLAAIALVAGAAEPTRPPVRSGAGVSSLPPAPARALFVRVCTMCHDAGVVTQKRHTPEEWDDLIARMVDRGAMASEEEQEQIFEYLVRFYGIGNPSRGARR